MSKLNKTVKRDYTSTAHLNHMGGHSWDVTDSFVRLRMVAASCFFGEPQYYNADDTLNREAVKSVSRLRDRYGETSMDYLCDVLGGFGVIKSSDECDTNPQKMMEDLIDQCLDKNIEKTLQLAVKLRNEDYIRSTPQVILVRAAMHPKAKGTGLIVKYGKDICTRGDEPAAGLSYFLATYTRKTALPNSLKKLWKGVLESFDDYVISKYRMDNNFVKTRDVVRFTHANSPAIDKLMAGKAKQTKTWNAVISNGDNSSKESKQKNWEDALKNMGHMALLRNLRNLVANGVEHSLFCDKLIKGVPGGKQLPFRYWSAYKALNGLENVGDVQDAVEQALEASFVNAPHFKGNVMCLSDNSGSAHGALTSELGTMSVAQIGNLMSVMTARMADHGYVGIFGDKLNVIEVRKKSSVFDLCEKANRTGHGIGGGTENGVWLFWDKAIREKQMWDHVFIYSDMQAGHGGLYGVDKNEYKDFIFPGSGNMIDVPKLINKYRREVNPNVMVYLVQTAGYHDVLIPEYYDRTFILGGWSQHIPEFAAQMSKIYDEISLNK